MRNRELGPAGVEETKSAVDMQLELIEVQDMSMHGDAHPSHESDIILPDQVLDEILNRVETPRRSATPGRDHDEVAGAQPEETNGLRYSRAQGAWVEEYPVQTAGMPVRMATEEEMSKYIVGEPGDIGALLNPEDFEVAEFMIQSGMSVKDRERFLKLSKFQGQMAWTSNYTMMKDVDKLHHDTTWKPYYKKVNGSKGTEVIQGWCRDTVAVLRDLFADKMLAKHMHYRPQKHWTTREQKDQQYGESWRSKHWWNAQNSIADEYATIGGYIIASDETPLTTFTGGKKAHPVYFTLANLPKDIRRKQSHRAMVLIGYLPVPDLSEETNQKSAQYLRAKLHNDCMREILKPLTDAERTGIEVVCPDGGVRRVYPMLFSCIADYPEQCRNGCTIGSYCPVCLVDPDARGDLNFNIPLRDQRKTLDAIAEHRSEGSAKFYDFGLHDQWPFWNRNTYVDIATIHTPDLLHQVHKGVFKDHLANWIDKALGSSTMDSRYQVMPHHHGIRHFKKGVSKLLRPTG